MVTLRKSFGWLMQIEDLKKIVLYIKKDSPQNAVKVKKEILEKISALSLHPEKYPPEKYKLLNSNSAYRAFELHRIRISYFADNNCVMIIRVRHTRQETLFY
jgi:plasmid stabilization system protein ParE